MPLLKALSYAALTLLALGLLSCSHVQSTPDLPQPRQLSPEAKATFTYLQYLDYRNQDQLDKARKALENATRLNPSPELYLEQGHLYWRQDLPHKAEQAVKKGLQSFPGQSDLTFFLAKLYLSQDKVHNALSLLQAYLKTHPQDQRARVELAKLYQQEKQYEDMVSTLEPVSDEDRASRLRYLLAKGYIGLGKRSPAIEELKKATRQNPDFLEAWAELAYQYEMAKDYAAAEDTYSKLLDKGAENKEILLRLIDLNLKLNNPDRALKLTERGSGSGDFLFNACSLFLQAGFYTKAEEVLQLLPESWSQEPKAQYFKALIAFHGDNDPARAQELLQGIPSDSPLFKRSLGLQARLALKQERPDKAREILHRAQESFPEERDFWLLESEILMSRKDYDQAAAVLQKGLKHVQRSSDLLFQLGVVAHEQGDKDRALEFMNRVLGQEPGHASAMNFIGYTLVELGRDMDRAHKLIRRALEQEPDNGYFLDSLAWYYYRSGQLEQAWETIQKAVSKAVEDPIIWEHYGDIATSLNLTQEARKGYSKSLELEPEKPGAIRSKLNTLPAP